MTSLKILKSLLTGFIIGRIMIIYSVLKTFLTFSGSSESYTHLDKLHNLVSKLYAFCDLHFKFYEFSLGLYSTA